MVPQGGGPGHRQGPSRQDVDPRCRAALQSPLHRPGRRRALPRLPRPLQSEAESFLVEVESSKREGKYVDVNAGEISFKTHAESWLKGQSPDRATREALRSRLGSRIYPFFEKRAVNSITATTIREWLGQLDDARLSQNYRTVLFTIVSSVLDAAVEERMIHRNPCKSQTIKRPSSPASNVVVWSRKRVDAIEQSIEKRFQLAVVVGAGCGLRQGEILGLSPEDVDRERQVVHVRRQLRTVDRTLVLALPKGGKTRVVPLSAGVLERITSHTEEHPPATLTLPWQDPAGDPLTIPLLMTGENGRLYSGDLFTKVIWQGAFRAAELDYRKRADGMHALRHFYASVLLAQGVSVKELAAYLGHNDPGFTLRTYTHLVPSSFERARAAVDGVFSPTDPAAHGLDTA